MHPCFQNRNSFGDTENLHQYNPKPPIPEVDSITLTAGNSHALPNRGPHTLHPHLLAPHQIGPSAVCWCGVIASSAAARQSHTNSLLLLSYATVAVPSTFALSSVRDLTLSEVTLVPSSGRLTADNATPALSAVIMPTASR